MAVVGCAHKKAPPPPSSSGIDLAGKHANYKDWRGVDACKNDPLAHWTDLEAMNALLTEFLAQTKGAGDDPWTPEQIAVLEAGVATLPPALDGLDSLTSAVGKCPFPKTSGVQDSAKTSDELSPQARKRIADAPAMIPRLKAAVELNKWKAAQAEAMKTGKESWCPPPTDKPKPNHVPEIYYASVDQHGSTEWVFCDELKVVQHEGAKPELMVEDPKKKPKNAKGYLDSAAKYPASEVQHAPKPGGSADTADGGVADAGTPAQG